MTLPDWTPTHCIHCLTYMGHDEGAWVEHDDGNGSGYRCPTCGHNWQAIPPDDWTGEMLVRTEREIQAPPIEHANRLDESPLYAGEKWTRDRLYG